MIGSAAAEARGLIHANDLDGLKQLLAEYPALLSWKGSEWDSKGGLLGIATGAYGDAFDPDRERTFTRAACAELLLDAGAVVLPPVFDGMLESRARGLLQLFQRRGLLPQTLKFIAALGDVDAVRTALRDGENDRFAVNEAFFTACRFAHRPVAALLLDRAIELDPELGQRVDRTGRTDFLEQFVELRAFNLAEATVVGPWLELSIGQIRRALHDNRLDAFVRGLHAERQLLGETFVWFQAELIATAALNDREAFIRGLLEFDPALLRTHPPPPSQAIEFAVTYANTHLIPLLTRIWPLPDDLPHAAGIGDLARVRQWFDDSGAALLGDLNRHYPYNDARAREHLHWHSPSLQQVLDTAFAFAVINRHFDVADFLFAHGANINTDWNSHEPASILHHLVFLPDSYDRMQFLIDRGIDLTIKDYRWNSTARGWALFGGSDPTMAEWLDQAERKR